MLARPGRSYEVAKRVLDVTIALIILVLFAPLWVLIAIVIRLASQGPVIFCIFREIGEDGREFTLYKFRTMYHNNDDSLHRRATAKFIVDGQPLDTLTENGVASPIYKMTKDPRVTPFGKLLRKTGLDEVPQFINVLRGEMSVVGPRPSMHYEYELYNDYQRQRLSVKPGITGLYQVCARSKIPFADMVELDLEYIARRSFWLDLWIILKTPWVMLTGKGAH